MSYGSDKKLSEYNKIQNLPPIELMYRNQNIIIFTLGHKHIVFFAAGFQN